MNFWGLPPPLERPYSDIPVNARHWNSQSNCSSKSPPTFQGLRAAAGYFQLTKQSGVGIPHLQLFSMCGSGPRLPGRSFSVLWGLGVLEKDVWGDSGKAASRLPWPGRDANDHILSGFTHRELVSVPYMQEGLVNVLFAELAVQGALCRRGHGFRGASSRRWQRSLV